MSIKTDGRQISIREFLDQISNPTTFQGADAVSGKKANESELDNLLRSINGELQPPFRLISSDPADLILNVNANIITNSETGRSKTNQPIAGIFLDFTGETATFPATGAGSITPSAGSSVSLGMSSNQFAKVLIQINSSGDLVLKVGTPNGLEANTLPPTPDADVFPAGYVVVATDGGNNVQVIQDSNIVQFTGGIGSGSGTSASNASTVDLIAGEAMDGTTTPLAVYPKLKKTITLTASNNVLSTSEGDITLNTGTFIYPYTEVETDMETKLNALGAVVFDVILDEEHIKITADTNFTIDKAVANSVALTLGFNTVDTATPGLGFEADDPHDFTIIVAAFLVNTTDDGSPPLLADGSFTPVAADHRSRSFSGFIVDNVAKGATITVQTENPLNGFSSLIQAVDYFTNGTAGEISDTSITNSLKAGHPVDGDTLFVDPINKGFEFKVEPDTDIQPDVPIVLPGWQSLPIQITTRGFDSALNDFAREGNTVIFANSIVSDTTFRNFRVSRDGGLTHYVLGDCVGESPPGSGVDEVTCLANGGGWTTSSLTALNANNNSHWHRANHKIEYVGNDKYVLLYDVPNVGQDLYRVVFDDIGTDITVGSPLMLAGGGSSDLQNMQLRKNGTGKVAALAFDAGPGAIGAAALVRVIHSTDYGATFPNTATINVRYSMYVSAMVDSGNRTIVAYQDNTSGNTDLRWTDNDAVSMSSAINLGAAIPTDNYPIGIKTEGNKVAIMMLSQNSTSSVYLTVCQDITAVTPVFSAPVDISDGVGITDTYNGDTTDFLNNSSSKYPRYVDSNILWLDSDRLICAFTRADGSGFNDIMLVDIPDSTALGTNSKLVALNGSSGNEYTEAGIICTDSKSEIHIVAKVFDGVEANNRSVGRLMTAKYNEGLNTFDAPVDRGDKASIAGDGFLGRVQIKGNSLIYEKEDTGPGTEEVFYQTLEV